jgi:ribonuclease HII
MAGRRVTGRFAGRVPRMTGASAAARGSVWNPAAVRAERPAGVDEAGRGSLAGPVVAAAVILPPDAELPGLTDSKLLTPATRMRLAEAIRAQAVAYAVAAVEAPEIDATDILRATLRAMTLAVSDLAPQPDLVLVDGNTLPVLSVPAQAIVRGDRLVPAISAASVLAKVTRDSIMGRWAAQFPAYGFAQHKGYGTAAHLAQIAVHGPCAIHRQSFAGVREHVGTAGAQGSLW